MQHDIALLHALLPPACDSYLGFGVQKGFSICFVARMAADSSTGVSVHSAEVTPHAQVVRRPGRDRPDVSAYLALFEHKIRDSNKLSPSETQAVAAFLPTAVPEFAIFASKDAVLKARPLRAQPARQCSRHACVFLFSARIS